MAVFINIIPKKRVLDASQLFSSSHVWNDRPSLHRNILYGKRSSFSTKFDVSSFISSKNKIKEGHSKRSKVDNFSLHRKSSFVDQ